MTDILRSYISMMVVILGGLACLPFLLPRDVEKANMLYDNGQYTEAMLIVGEVDASDLSSGQYAMLARMYSGSGEPERAVGLLEMAVTKPEAPPRLDDMLAYYYGKQHQFEKKYAVLSTLAEDYLNEDACRDVQSYYRATNQLGQETEILEIMRTRGFSTPSELVRLARIYLNDGRTEAARELFQETLSEDLAEVSRADVHMMVRLLEENQQTSDIVPLVEGWVEASPTSEELLERAAFAADRDMDAFVFAKVRDKAADDERFYPLFEQVTYNLRSSGDPYREAYVEIIANRIGSLKSNEQFSQALYELFSVMPADDAFRLASETAPMRSGFIDTVYLSHLNKQGRRDDIIAFHEARYYQDGQSIAERFERIEQIVEQDGYAQADMLLRHLILEAGPKREYIDALTYGWRQMHRSPDVDWIGRQLLSSSGSDFEAWEQLFLQSGAANELVDWLDERADQNPLRPRVLSTRVKLAGWEDNAPRLGRARKQLVQHGELSADELSEMLDVACYSGDEELSRLVAETLSVKQSFNPAQNLCLARFSRQATPEQIAYYRAAESGGASLSFDDLVRLGHATAAVSNKAEAQAYFKRALELIDDSGLSGVEKLRVRAQIEMDIGARAAVKISYRKLLEHDLPEAESRRIRKTLMQMYVDDGEYDAAIEVSCTEEACVD